MNMLEIVTVRRPTREGLGLFGKIPLLRNILVLVLTEFAGRTEFGSEKDFSREELKKLAQGMRVTSPDGRTEVVAGVHRVW